MARHLVRDRDARRSCLQRRKRREQRAGDDYGADDDYSPNDDQSPGDDYGAMFRDWAIAHRRRSGQPAGRSSDDARRSGAGRRDL